METRNYKELFESGNKAQLEKLEENEHKRGYDNIGLGYARERIKRKCEELFIELGFIPLTNPHFKPAIERVREKAANVANFTHMIIFKCDKILKKERR